MELGYLKGFNFMCLTQGLLIIDKQHLHKDIKYLYCYLTVTGDDYLQAVG